MGFGAVISSGEGNELLPDDLVDCIVEVRVEKSLDQITRFAIRFQEDIQDGEPRIMKAAELQCTRMITIAAPVDEKLQCLVRGPITDVKCSVTLGGQGSWFEVHGQDNRILLDRKCMRRAWSGRASEVAETILSARFKTDIAKTSIVYGGSRSVGQESTQTLNQRATDNEFIYQIARQNNFHFWIGYDCSLAGFTGNTLDVTETAHLKPSPDRPKDSPAGPLPIDLIQLVPNSSTSLRVNVNQDLCQNVTAFELTVNPEQPSEVTGTALDDRDLSEHPTTVKDPQPVLDPGQRLADCQVERDLCITTAGNQEEHQTKAESALTDAGWFVNATASTTEYLLGAILTPHDIIGVEGLGPVHSGAYQVKSVTHVINAADHFTDLKLQRNTMGASDDDRW